MMFFNCFSLEFGTEKKSFKNFPSFSLHRRKIMFYEFRVDVFLQKESEEAIYWNANNNESASCEKKFPKCILNFGIIRKNICTLQLSDGKG